MSPGRLPGVVFAFAYETWADAVSRQMSWSADRMVERVLVDTEVPSVLVSNPLRSRLGRLRRPMRATGGGFPAQPGRVLVQPVRWRRQDDPNLKATCAAYRRFDRWLSREADRRKTGGVLVTCHPVHAAVADRGRWDDVVYYGWDDWLSYPPFAPAGALMAWSYAQMAQRDVHVVGVSDAVVTRIGSSRSTVVPNAMSARDYADLPPPPSWFSDLPGPVALYAGSLEQRVDVAGLLAAADDRPEWTFVLVGHLGEPPLFADLLSRPNVRFAGHLPRPTVLALMGAATVCLVAHRETPMSVAMSPLKLYEYLGAGAVVVATDLPPVRGVSDRCLLVPPGSSWAPALDRAAALPPVDPVALEQWRWENDWDRRYVLWRTACLGAPEATRSA